MLLLSGHGKIAHPFGFFPGWPNNQNNIKRFSKEKINLITYARRRSNDYSGLDEGEKYINPKIISPGHQGQRGDSAQQEGNVQQNLTGFMLCLKTIFFLSSIENK